MARGGARGVRVDQLVSATRRGPRRASTWYGCDSPLQWRAHRSSRGPAEIDSMVPSAATQSSDKVLGDRPPSTAAMIAGHASSVESNRPSTLFDGISRSAYPTAPSMRISTFSPGFRMKGLGAAVLQSIELVSGRSSSSISGARALAAFVFTAFALRGAPCGDDPRPRAALRRYHEQEPTSIGKADHPESIVRPSGIRRPPRQGRFGDRHGLFERDPVLGHVDTRLLRIPAVPRHHGTVGAGAYPGLNA